MGVGVICRPLLVSGMLATCDSGTLILIDSEQHPFEQTVALFHEVLHLLGLRDELTVEIIARRLAERCPSFAREVMEAQGSRCGQDKPST